MDLTNIFADQYKTAKTTGNTGKSRDVRKSRTTDKKSTEAPTLKAILEYLDRKNIYAWRNNTGATKTKRKDGSEGYISFGFKGSSDIIGIYKGRFLAIEVKDKKGSLSKDQKKFLKRIEDEGGIAIVARELSDVYARLV